MRKTWTVYPASAKQTEDYSVIPNYFFSDTAMRLGALEFKVLMYMVRNTYGFHRDTYSVGMQQIARDCHMSYGSASNAVNALVDGKYLKIIKEGNKRAGTTRVYQPVFGYIETAIEPETRYQAETA